MIYRVIIGMEYRELWFDFIEFSQACVFAEAAKLKNVPNNPTKYGADKVEWVKVRLLTVEEHEQELKDFEAKVDRIRRELKEEEAANYAE